MNSTAELLQNRFGIGGNTAEKHCETHGAFTSKQGLRGLWTGCPVCLTEQNKAETARLISEMQAAASHERETKRIAEAIVSAGIPKKFRDKRVNNYTADCDGQKSLKRFAIEFVKEFEQEHSGRSVVFWGNRGTGKNHIACAIANGIIEQYGKTAHFTTASDMLRQIREAKRPNSQVLESDVIGALVSFDLLVIDEARFVSQNSEPDERAYFDVFNTRYAEEKPTIFICNGTLQEFEASVGDLFVSRLRESNGKPWNVRFDWEDHRK